MHARLRWLLAIATLIVFAAFSARAQAQEIVLTADAAQTSADFILNTTFHTVHGNFRAKRGELHFDPASGKVTGALVFDATSGQSANDGRDKKMQKDVLETQTYPEITFRPDRVEGKVGPGTSNVQVHGQFNIHGADHEITVPTQVTLAAGTWTATAHFSVPYVQWGMKSPSVLFLRVNNSVDLEFHGSGKLTP
jgi:polyisoprenoid-binding protein YceI